MRPIQPYRRRSSASFWLGTLLVLLVGSGGVVGLLLLLDVNLNPFAAPSEDPFMVRIPINSQPIPAYERVAREHLLNPATGGIMYQRVPPPATIGLSITGVTADGSHVESHVESVRNVDDQVVFVSTDGHEISHGQTLELGGALMNVNAIIGRVVKKDKRAGMGFREDTFFPQGTPEGIAGATPPGMRAVTLDATKLTGVHALNAGDQIDLIASVPTIEVGSFNSQYDSRLPGAALVAPASSESSKQNAVTEPVLLAQNALVLKPVYVRNEATASSSLTQGKRIQNVPKYEVAIAVAPDDVIPLQAALNKSLAITCIAHSMQSVGEATESATQATDPDQLLAPVTVRAILAYDVVTREAFVSPATRRIRMEPVDRQQIGRLGIITSLDGVLGAVARHDIPAGSFLRKSDLLSGSVEERGEADKVTVHDASFASRQMFADFPVAARKATVEQPTLVALQQPVTAAPDPTVVGDRPAITSFVPAGRTAFAIPWNRLYGAEHLQIGDAIDLLASYSLESEDEEEETETRPDGTKIVRKRNDIATRTTQRTWDESFGFRGEPWFVATDAVVIGPVGFPAPASAQRALGESLSRTSAAGSTPSFAGPPVLIAVDDRDVEAVATALVTQRVLFTTAFHPSGTEDATPEGLKRIAIAAQNIDAFQLFSETVWNGNRRRSLSRAVPVDDLRFADALTVAEISDFEYRVLKRAKYRGDFFTADDFLPEGTGPGVAAAAGPGQTVFAVADREIEGLDTFQANDFVAILIRGVVKPLSGVVTHGLNLQRPVSSVVVPAARIVRASLNGQTVLEVANEDLTRLQAAWAASMSREEEQGDSSDRSHLLAVALPRGEAPHIADRAVSMGVADLQPTDSPAEDIPAFDPLSGLKFMEAIVGSRREFHAFPAAQPADSASHDSRSFNFARQ